MKKLYTAILTITALTMGSQLLAGPLNPQPPAPAPVPVVVPVPVLPAMDEHGILDLSNLELGDADIIARAPHFPEGMTQLLLMSNNIGHAGAQAIANNLNRAPDLHYISFMDNHIGDAGIIALAQHLPAGLQGLILASNNIHDAGVEALAQQPLPLTLRNLNLADNHIGDAGIIALAHRLQQNPIAHFHILNLDNNEFGADGRQALNAAGYEEMGGVGLWLRNLPVAEAAPVH